MHTDMQVSLALLNCYPKKSRDRFDMTDTGHPHDMFLDFIRRYLPGAQVDIIYVADPDATLPNGANLASYDGYIWTGSDLTIYHFDDERVTRQFELSQQVFEAGIPQYGSCWGLQLAACVAGGEVQKNPKGREWCIARDITLTDAGRESPFLRDKPEKFDAFIMHLDEVTRLPEGATLYATNEHTSIQSAEIKYANGTFWSPQYHPEYTLYEMARLIRARSKALVREKFFAEEDEALAFAGKLLALAEDPDSAALRAELDIGDDILDDNIRQTELRNWIDYLVLPALKR